MSSISHPSGIDHSELLDAVEKALAVMIEYYDVIRQDEGFDPSAEHHRETHLLALGTVFHQASLVNLASIYQPVRMTRENRRRCFETKKGFFSVYRKGSEKGVQQAQQLQMFKHLPAGPYAVRMELDWPKDLVVGHAIPDGQPLRSMWVRWIVVEDEASGSQDIVFRKGTGYRPTPSSNVVPIKHQRKVRRDE